MRGFERSEGRLRQLPTLGRLVYSVFLAFTIAATALTVWLTDELVGIDLSRAQSYYAGAVELPSEGSGPTSDGPAIELPGEPLFESAQEPISTRKLLEVTHFHVFTVPVYLLILSHLYLLTSGRKGPKCAWIGVGSAGAALHIAAPWMAAAGSSLSVALYATSGLALMVSFLWMALAGLWDMWRPLPR